MGRRGALDGEELSAAQCQNTPQGVHPASHLRTGGRGVKSTHVDFLGTRKGGSPQHEDVAGNSPTGRGTQASSRQHEHGKDEQQSASEGGLQNRGPSLVVQVQVEHHWKVTVELNLTHHTIVMATGHM
jgi:hypothetical protein